MMMTSEDIYLCRNLHIKHVEYDILGQIYTKKVYKRCCQRYSEEHRKQCQKCQNIKQICPCLNCSNNETRNLSLKSKDRKFHYFSNLGNDIISHVNQFMDPFVVRCLKSTSDENKRMITGSSLKLKDTDWVNFLSKLITIVYRYNSMIEMKCNHLLEDLCQDFESLVNESLYKDMLQKDKNLNEYAMKILNSIKNGMTER